MPRSSTTLAFVLAFAFALAFALPCAAMPPGPSGQALAAQQENNPPPASAMPTVEIVGAAPLPGLELPRERIPANVQTLDRAAATGADSVNLPDAINRRLGSVFVNEIQGNPFQPDLVFRGYTASPLLGTPQGLSVYMDGVRMNQPFGDVVSWDLIPRTAVAAVVLMPGSNPLFGLNTLGGALAIRTKDGLRDPGGALQWLAGQFGRQELVFEHGGHDARGRHWYLSGLGFKENGWRDASPIRLGHLFGKLGWHDRRSDLALSAAWAGARLGGNGLQEQRLLARERASVYTTPDRTANRSMLLHLMASHALDDRLRLSANLYYRAIRSRTLNGDLHDEALGRPVYQPDAAEQAALAAAGYRGFPAAGAGAADTPFPFWRCIAGALLAGQAAENPAGQCNGLLNRTASRQRSLGLSVQAAGDGRLAGRPHQFIVGAAFDASHLAFRQSSQFGYLNAERGVVPVGLFADGSTRGDDGLPIDTRVELGGRIRTASVYASDTLRLLPRLHLTVSGRYNRSTVRNLDRLLPGGGPGSLAGAHRFERLNPALGASWDAPRGLNLYAGYNEGSRTPSVIELGCADPDHPCKLPNAMAGDPPLRQVVSRTWEAGLRGRPAPDTRWNAGLFHAENTDDILFVAADAAGFGYFRNVGKTRRQGIELGLAGRAGALAYAVNATWLDARFRSAERLGAAANSSADADGGIAVRPGQRLPLVPRGLFKARAEWRPAPAWTLEANMQAASGANARGNENGMHRPDGRRFVGGGGYGGHAVFDLGASWAPTPRLRLFVQVGNLFDRRYATAAQLNASGLTAQGNFIAQPFAAEGDPAGVVASTFYAPGAPRSFRAGLRYALGD